MNHLKELKEIIGDVDAETYKLDLLNAFNKFLKQFNSEAMSDYTIFLKGQEDMLKQVIEFIENN